MSKMTGHAGGSFAPPLDGATLDAYGELAGKASPPVAEAMNILIKMAAAYRARPAAKGKGKASAPAAASEPHPSGLGAIVALAPAEVERLDPVVPWDHELKMYGELFEGIDAGADKATRDAAFHLLWLGRELFLDREPIFTTTL